MSDLYMYEKITERLEQIQDDLELIKEHLKIEDTEFDDENLVDKDEEDVVEL